MKTNQLVIYRDVFGGWRWERLGSDGEVRDSQFSYDTRAECAADANRRGLLPHRSMDSDAVPVAMGRERRSERSLGRKADLVQGRSASRDAPALATSR